VDPKALYKISYGVYVIGTKLDGKDAGCTVDAFIQSTSSPVPTAILCSIQANQTNKAIKQTGEFTVSILPTDVDPFIIANFGFQSGREADKWANVAHKYVDGLPMLERAAAFLRCKVTDFKELSTHTAFFCEVVDAWQGEGEPLIYGDYQKNLKAKAQEAFKAFKEGQPITRQQEKRVCSVCGYVYSGDIPFTELPEDYKCPICAAPKKAFIKQP